MVRAGRTTIKAPMIKTLAAETLMAATLTTGRPRWETPPTHAETPLPCVVAAPLMGGLAVGLLLCIWLLLQWALGGGVLGQLSSSLSQ